MTTWNIRGVDNFLNTEDVVVEFSENEEEKRRTFDWLNWVSLDIDERNDAIHMHLSTGDPRGSQFSISLTRPMKWADDTKCLIFDARKDNCYSPIRMSRIYGETIKNDSFKL